MSTRYGVATFVEGDFRSVFVFESDAVAEAFADGVHTGAGYYAGDGCSAFVWPPRSDVERDDLIDAVGADEVAKAWVAWQSEGVER